MFKAMLDLNSVTLTGNLLTDPEISAAPGFERGVPITTPVARFTLACRHNLKSARKEEGEEVEEIPVVAFGSLAERIARQLNSGSWVVINGKIHTYQLSEGQKLSKAQYGFELILTDFWGCSGRDPLHSVSGKKSLSQVGAKPLLGRNYI